MQSTNPEILTTAAPPAMRWKMGRNFWRRDRDEGFRPADYAVDVIRYGAARAFVVENHYSHSMPVTIESIGLFHGLDLVGVATFSIPINNSVVPRYTGQPADAGAELGRFVLLDSVPYNGESFFLAVALKALKTLQPHLRTVVAYSDPRPRTTRAGDIIMPGHIGCCYQASNAHYLGRATAKTLHITPQGIALSTRAISKVRLQEHGAASAEKMIVRLGAPPRAVGQDPATWIEKVLEHPEFRRVRHPGNHVYCWALGKKNDRHALARGFAPARVYPKSLDPEQGVLFE
jgi:hypothetical protein